MVRLLILQLFPSSKRARLLVGLSASMTSRSAPFLAEMIKLSGREWLPEIRNLCSRISLILVVDFFSVINSCNSLVMSWFSFHPKDEEVNSWCTVKGILP